MDRGEEEENWKRDREIDTVSSLLSVQMGFVFTALVLCTMHFFFFAENITHKC